MSKNKNTFAIRVACSSFNIFLIDKIKKFYLNYNKWKYLINSKNNLNFINKDNTQNNTMYIQNLMNQNYKQFFIIFFFKIIFLNQNIIYQVLQDDEQLADEKDEEELQ